MVFALIMTPAMIPAFAALRADDRRRKLHFMRGATVLGSSLFFITGLAFLPIAEASATGFVAPLFVTALRSFSSARTSACAAGSRPRSACSACIIILRPGTSAFHIAAFFPLVSALAWACTLIMTRMLSGTERAITTMAYSSIAGVCHPLGAGAVRLGHADLAGGCASASSSASPPPRGSGSSCWRSAMPMPPCWRRSPTPNCCGSASSASSCSAKCPTSGPWSAPASSSPAASTPPIASGCGARNCAGCRRILAQRLIFRLVEHAPEQWKRFPQRSCSPISTRCSRTSVL